MTHKKIAELAHVSASTVSKALSGSAEVSKELADEIRSIALEVGYFEEKNKRSKNYRKNTALNIAVLVPEIVSVTYSSTVSLIKTEVEKRGGFVSVYVFDFDHNKLDTITEMIMVKGFADAIISFYPPQINFKPSIPVLCISKTDNRFYDTVTANMTSAMGDVIDYLKSKGHTKIGYAGELKTSTKLESYITAMKNSGLCINDKFIYVSDQRFGDAGKDTADMYLKAEERPTAVVFAYDEIAIAFMNELSINGVNVPSDVSVVGINNIPACEYCTPKLTTLSTEKENVYEICINRFMDKIMKGSSEIIHTEIAYELIERESVLNIK